jgi:hypothetical protein
MSVLVVAETLLWAALAFLFWRRGFQRRFRATGAYLFLRAAAGAFLLLLLELESTPWGPAHRLGTVYFYSYFAMYVASAVLLYSICIEVFRAALSPFPSIANLTVVVFRWAVVASAILGFASMSYGKGGIAAIFGISYGLMRSMSILEICLLAFLCLTMNALRMSPRDMAFGIALGFGVMSAGDFVLAAWVNFYGTVNDPVQFVAESLILAALGVWVTYCLLPEPAPRPVLLPANSTIYRWNEIASALGHPGTKVAIQQPANSFFLSDVERVVEKVLARNMNGRGSET